MSPTSQRQYMQQIETLRAENAKLREEITDLLNTQWVQGEEYAVLTCEVQKLKEQLAACQKDAERYRMARSGKCNIELCEFGVDDGEFYGLSMLKGDYADEQLDAAIAVQKEKKE